MKTWVMLFDKENAVFMSREFNKVMSSIVISAEEEAIIRGVYDKVVEVLEGIDSYHEPALCKKVRQKMKVETHFISLIPFFKDAMDRDIYDDDMGDFVVSLFTDEIIVSEAYKNASSNGSAKAANIQIRDEEIRKRWDSFLKENGFAD